MFGYKQFNEVWEKFYPATRQVFGSELSYQALLYHTILEHTSDPRNVNFRSVALNVKIGIYKPLTHKAREKAKESAEGYQDYFGCIPDLVVFKNGFHGNHKRANGVRNLLWAEMLFELKVNERTVHNENTDESRTGRIRPGEIIEDIDKLVILREEAEEHIKIGSKRSSRNENEKELREFLFEDTRLKDKLKTQKLKPPRLAVIVIDTFPEGGSGMSSMTESGLKKCRDYAKEKDVRLYYVNNESHFVH